MKDPQYSFDYKRLEYVLKHEKSPQELVEILDDTLTVILEHGKMTNQEQETAMRKYNAVHWLKMAFQQMEQEEN